MAQAAAVPFLMQFAALRDPRQKAKVLYPLTDLHQGSRCECHAQVVA